MNSSPLLKQNETLTGLDLTDENKCRDYLEKVTKKIQSPSLLVTASQFSKWYARCITAPALTSMTIDEKGFDLSLQSSVIQTDWSEDIWSPQLHFRAETREVTNVKPDRKLLVKKVFADHLSPIWRTLSAISNLPIPILWENTAVRVFSLYEKKLQKDASFGEIKRIQEDLNYLVHEAPGSLFGERSNPLRPFYGSKEADVDEMFIRKRKTCCFYYEVCGKETFCTACPKRVKNYCD